MSGFEILTPPPAKLLGYNGEPCKEAEEERFQTVTNSQQELRLLFREAELEDRSIKRHSGKERS